ncbi:MAG TPA: TlpA disulfide reductase family protein [Verrucomicrobiae bacterium]|nr:TlpA disulfide reductase family protein [Verrucomicrobiae bacterium]
MKDCFKMIPGCLMAFALFTLNARADGANPTEAQAWAALTNFSLLHPPMAWATNPPTQADLAKFDDDQAARAGVLADQARDFYTRFASSANVSRARVTEVQALQLALHYGATNRLGDLEASEQAIIDDTNAPVALRYQLRLDQIGRELPAESAKGVDARTALEKAGRELVKDFPNGSAGYNILMDLATGADLLKMHELAMLMADSGGPPELTDLGKGLQRRIDAVGKPLAIEFTAADGRAVNLTTLSNQVVLVDFWATWCPECVTFSPKIKKLYDQLHSKGFDVVGINFDDDTNKAQQFIREHDLPWPQYFGGRGPDNQFGREYSISALPVMWLVDRKGIVRDIHGTTELEAKVAKLMAE